MLIERITGFVSGLRRQGYTVGIAECADALRVAEHCGLTDLKRLRWGLRSLLCGKAEDWQRFDALFDAYFLPTPSRNRPAPSSRPSKPEGLERAFAQWKGRAGAEADNAQSGKDEDAEGHAAKGGASRQESAGRCDFALLADVEQMEAMGQMAERLARKMRRRLRRRQRLARTGRRVHLRATLRRSLAYGGMPFDLVFSRCRRRLPRLVFLLDASRSMSLYSYFFLRFARGLLGAFVDAQAFVFHTRLIPVSEVLREPDIQRVKQKLSLLAMGWSGGTRISESLEQFNRQHARQVLNSRSIVIVMSDGFDTGPPKALAEQLEAIRGRARKLVWLNPLLGREGYQPLAGGMAAALPLLDVFAPAHNLASLAALEPLLTSL